MCSDEDAAVLAAAGFPIRKSPVITLACSLPRLIAAGHVLLRLLAPRHPPCALSSLTFSPTILVNPKARMRTYKLYLYSSFYAVVKEHIDRGMFPQNQSA